jgi:hypothetical protein
LVTAELLKKSKKNESDEPPPSKQAKLLSNQPVLKNETPPDVDIDMLNERSKDLKQFARDVFFIRQIQSNKRCVSAITLNDHRVWVSQWQRIVTCKNSYTEGTRGTLYFSLDMNQSTWKRRMVFRFEDTTNQE